MKYNGLRSLLCNLRTYLLVALALAMNACQNDHREPSDESAWLKGSVDERFEVVARHLRGFDVAMVETGHRYSELYWAGRDTNWLYAKYQAEKIRLAIQNGLERRPKRAASAEAVLKFVLPGVEQAIQARDLDLFWRSFATLTLTCNACHVAEKVEFVLVRPPDVRHSPVKRTP